MGKQAGTEFAQVAVIVADGALDSVQDWASDAVDHVKDLKAAGHVVRTIICSYPTKEQAWRAARHKADAMEASA